MEKIQIFRIILLFFSVVGFTLCFIALLLPYWLEISTAAYDGYYGLFTFCIYNYGSDVVCSDVMFTNVNGYFQRIQVFMCLGFLFYTICTILASITFFWSKRLRVIRGIKYAVAVFAMFSAMFLIAAAVILKENYDTSRETLSFGWYITIVSLAIAIIAVPSYIMDAFQTVKPNIYINNNIMNIRPQPTELTAHQAQNMIDSFNNQKGINKSKLPEPLALRAKLTLLYDQRNRHVPPRPTTPYGSDDNMLEVISTDVHFPKQPIIVPQPGEYRFGSLYDDDFIHPSPRSLMVPTDDEFVHPPPKLISDNISLTDILRKNFQASSVQNSPGSSRRSSSVLQGGQLDDSDLEIYLLTKGFRTPRGSFDDRPPSQQAFGKQKRKKKHKKSSKVVGEKNITEISHDGLPTIKVIGPDWESRDYREPMKVEYDSALSDKETIGVSKTKQKRSSSSRSSRREKVNCDNKGYYSNDDCKKGQDTEQDIPMQVPLKNSETEKRPKKKSSKRKKHKRQWLEEKSCESGSSRDDKTETELTEGKDAVQLGVKENVDSSKHRHSSKKKKHRREKSEELVSNGNVIDDKSAVEVGHAANDENDEISKLKIKEHVLDDHELMKPEIMNETGEKFKSELGGKTESKTKKKKRKKSKERRNPYLGNDLMYDVIGSEENDSTKNDDCNEESIAGAIDEILEIPSNHKSEQSKL